MIKFVQKHITCDMLLVCVKYFLGIMKNACLNNRLSHQEWRAMYGSFDTLTFFTKETLMGTGRSIETCITINYQVNKHEKKCLVT